MSLERRNNKQNNGLDTAKMKTKKGQQHIERIYTKVTHGFNFFRHTFLFCAGNVSVQRESLFDLPRAALHKREERRGGFVCRGT